MSKKTDHIRARWAAYLAQIMKGNPGTTTGALARELILPKTRAKLQKLHAPGIQTQYSSPRSHVRRWLRGGGTVRASSAFKAGEALRILGVPLTSGVVALFAAGYYPEVVEILVRMSRENGGALPALAYYASLEHWLHRWVLSELFWSVDEPYDFDTDDDRIKDARILAEAAISNSSTMLTDVWRSCSRGLTRDWWVKKAMLAADFESESDARESFQMAWGGMKSWAGRLFVECGGKRGASPYAEYFRLGDYMPQLELLKALL